MITIRDTAICLISELWNLTDSPPAGTNKRLENAFPPETEPKAPQAGGSAGKRERNKLFRKAMEDKNGPGTEIETGGL